MARPSTSFCAFITLLNDRLGESIVFPLLPFLLASFTGNGRTLGLLAGSYAVAQFAFTPLIGALSDRFGRLKRESDLRARIIRRHHRRVGAEPVGRLFEHDAEPPHHQARLHRRNPARLRDRHAALSAARRWH